MKNTKTAKRVLAIFIALLILIYTSMLFLPHTHESGYEDCAVCTVIESILSLIGAATCASALRCADFGYRFALSARSTYPRVASSPVARKDKLSN